MSRTRLIKPSTFKNEYLAACSPLARILFTALWTLSDRDGKLEDRPRRIKADALPYDDCDINNLLDELSHGGFITRYETNGIKVILVNTFKEHQRPHPSEPKSVLPNLINENNILKTSHVEAIKTHDNKCEIVPSLNTSNPSPSNPFLESNTFTADAIGEKPPNIFDAEFQAIWVAWKPFDIDKGSKDAAKKSYLKSRKEVSHAEIIGGCERYLAYCHAKQQRTQHLVTFLNQRNWQGEYPDAINKKPTTGWIAEGDRLAAKYAAEAELERQQQANSQPSPEPGLCLAAPVREDLGRA